MPYDNDGNWQPPTTATAARPIVLPATPPSRRSSGRSSATTPGFGRAVARPVRKAKGDDPVAVYNADGQLIGVVDLTPSPRSPRARLQRRGKPAAPAAKPAPPMPAGSNPTPRPRPWRPRQLRRRGRPSSSQRMPSSHAVACPGGTLWHGQRGHAARGLGKQWAAKFVNKAMAKQVASPLEQGRRAYLAMSATQRPGLRRAVESLHH